MKTAVYSWRISPETKSALEEEARQRGETLAELLDRITSDWLTLERAAKGEDQKREARLRERALRACGTIAGGDPSRSVHARDELRLRLRSKRVRER